MRDKGKGRDRKRRRGPKGRKEESVGKKCSWTSTQCFFPMLLSKQLHGNQPHRSAVLSEKPQGLSPAATAVGRASSLPITLRRQAPTDLHSFSGTCPWPCSPAPDSILFSGGPALEGKQKWVSLEWVRGQWRSFCKRYEACCSYKRATYSTNI